MSEILPTYTERQKAARERLRVALDPQTNRERHLVDWLLGCFTADEADEWSEMVERVESVAIDRMDLAELGDLLVRITARVDQLRDAELDVVHEFDANRANR